MASNILGTGHVYKSTILWLFLILSQQQYVVSAAVDLFDNDLAKVCRPVDQPLDIIFILDGSGSVEGSTFDTQLQMLNRVVDMVDIGEDKTKIAVMQYASYTYIEFLFKAFKDKASVREAIRSINHKLGTTKTGKALDRATQLFNDPSTGSRRGASSGKQQNIAQVAILVSDGHSHDNPFPAAKRLRDSGVHLIALGIGPHINRDELLEMTGDSDLVFDNLSQPSQVTHFMETLRMRFAISEACEYSRGVANEGADVRCERNGALVSVTTRAPFGGHFYVQGHSEDAHCKWRANHSAPATEMMSNGNKTPTNMSGEGGDELSLLVPFDGCGVQRQFSINPKGIIFQANVVLQFHPIYNTAIDKVFKVHCLYQDKSSEQEGDIDWQLIKEHTQRKSKKNKKILPCSMQILGVNDSDNLTAVANSSICQPAIGTNFRVGQPLTFKWECSSDNYDIYQSILIHSCYMIDVKTSQRELLIDRNGCSTLERLVDTPTYPTSLTAVSRAVAFRKGDSPLLRIECSLRFCDRLMSECDNILPPKCHQNWQMSSAEKHGEASEEEANRLKRQIGIPVSIRSLSETPTGSDFITGLPPLVMFNRKNMSKRHRSQQRRVFSVVNLPARLRTAGSTDIRLITQDVRIVGESARENIIHPIVDVDAATKARSTPLENMEEDDGDLPPQIAKTLQQHGIKEPFHNRNKPIADDPFQESQRIVESIAEEKSQKPIVTDLESYLLESISLNEITVQSEIVYIQEKSSMPKTDKCLPHN